ncbi:MAG TPA: hypothetical protein VI997_07100, partial [Candidatus Thermoplasmatota archaeon]|nr:hypothetical protein [Candidatus Thermoplasmatota archaeon]
TDAAAILAEAAGDALPGLVGLATSATTIGTTLRMSDGAADTFTTQFLVSVDQGGDDTYIGSASAGAGGPFPVMLLLELAGNDNYLASSPTGGVVIAQGAGSGLGAGVLVDALGDDDYTATSTANPTCSPAVTGATATVVAQGAGHNIGAGALVDLDGLDTWSALATSCGGHAITVAQGGGYSIGVGALAAGDVPSTNLAWDNEAYRAEARSTLLMTSPTQGVIGTAITVAHGGGAAVGAGAFAEVGGNDRLDAIATGGNALTVAQGAGNVGVGILADANGDDVRAASATGSLTPSSILGPAAYSSVETFASATNGLTDVTAHGAAVTGLGALLDAAGNDKETATSSSTTKATASSITTYSPGTTKATAIASSQGARTTAQGVALTGVAAHVDLAGSDSYAATAYAETRATATASGGASNTAAASATCGAASVAAQGVGATGAGAHADGLGADSYTTTVTWLCTATKNGAAGTLVPGAGPSVQQDGKGTTGAGAFADLDGADTKTTSGPTSWTNGACWTNSPPSNDLNLGIGANWNSPTSVPTSCLPPPN